MANKGKVGSAASDATGLRLRTFISPVIRRGPDGKPQDYLADGQTLCWMDQLLDGGIFIPGGVLRGEEPPLLWLVTGPPGTGKTTFALELCHRLATKNQDWPTSDDMAEVFTSPTAGRERDVGARLNSSDFNGWLSREGIARKKATVKDMTRYLDEFGQAKHESNRIRSLFIALESPFERIAENMARFGWDTTGVKEPRPDLGSPPGDIPVKNLSALMWVLGSREIERISPQRPHDILRRIGDRWNDTWGRHPSGRNAWPGVVVIDSLNTLPRDREPQQAMIEDIRQGLRTRTWLVIVICEGGSETAQPWEYLADIITRFGEDKRKGYLLRTLRVVKAKNQSHAWGDHRLKIYSDPRRRKTGIGLGRVSPYIRQGGIYVFPSVSRLLGSTWSGHGETSGPSPGIPDAPLPRRGMGVLVGKRPRISADKRKRPGLPGGRCTAFIGQRGLMKSHLAYLWLLARLKSKKSSRALLVSMRDDEGAALETLRTISKYESDLDVSVPAMYEEGRLRILHLWPGYIPPEEFMHNVVVRLDSKVDYCVVNGIDHLAARLPLCADLDIFVPALVSLLTAEGVTTVLSATEEAPGSLQAMGLLPMADLVLRFSSVDEDTLANISKELELPPGVEQIARITAERVPAGGIGGRYGYLFRDPGTACAIFKANRL